MINCRDICENFQLFKDNLDNDDDLDDIIKCLPFKLDLVIKYYKGNEEFSTEELLTIIEQLNYLQDEPANISKLLIRLKILKINSNLLNNDLKKKYESIYIIPNLKKYCFDMCGMSLSILQYLYPIRRNFEIVYICDIPQDGPLYDIIEFDGMDAKVKRGGHALFNIFHNSFTCKAMELRDRLCVSLSLKTIKILRYLKEYAINENEDLIICNLIDLKNKIMECRSDKILPDNMWLALSRITVYETNFDYSEFSLLSYNSETHRSISNLGKWSIIKHDKSNMGSLFPYSKFEGTKIKILEKDYNLFNNIFDIVI